MLYIAVTCTKDYIQWNLKRKKKRREQKGERRERERRGERVFILILFGAAI